jgi:hypothetical protein
VHVRYFYYFKYTECFLQNALQHEMRPSDLDESVFEDLSDLEADLDRINLDSPLQLLSPNTILENEGVKNPWQGRPCSAGPIAEEKQKKAVTPPLSSEDTVSNLPSFNRKNKIDPRRQSTAIFSALKLSSSGAGLLEDSEIALAPDEDLLIPLNKSIPFAITKKSTLWIDPNNEELMDLKLPEPEFLSLKNPLSPKRIEESVDEGTEQVDETYPSPPCERKENAIDFAESFQTEKAITNKGFLKPSRLRAPSSSSRFFQSCASQLNSR